MGHLVSNVMLFMKYNLAMLYIGCISNQGNKITLATALRFLDALLLTLLAKAFVKFHSVEYKCCF